MIVINTLRNLGILGSERVKERCPLFVSRFRESAWISCYDEMCRVERNQIVLNLDLTLENKLAL